MPDRPPPPASGSLGSALQTGVALAELQQAQELRRRLSLVCMAGVLSGYFAMHNQWVQVGWLALVSLAWIALGGLPDLAEGWKKDSWMGFTALSFLAILSRSTLLDSPGLNTTSLWQGWMSSCLLLLVFSCFWQALQQRRALHWLGITLICVAVASALGSMAVFYFLDDQAVIGRRLNNWFIYGGWNSVCSGMTWGFAAVWASHRWSTARKPSESWFYSLGSGFLIVATLLTLSRGALLALWVAHIAWWLVSGWSRVRRSCLLLLTCTVIFQLGAPWLTRLALEDVSQNLGVSMQELTPEMVADGVMVPNPAARVIERGDNGRFQIYAAGIQSMTTWQDWLWGKGLWAASDFWSCSLHWYPEHLHSAYLDCLVRLGVSGLVVLAVILTWSLKKAFRLAKKGDSFWWMLLAYGAVGLLFDGDSAFGLLTLPRFETLIFWLPLVGASATYWKLKKGKKEAGEALDAENLPLA